MGTMNYLISLRNPMVFGLITFMRIDGLLQIFVQPKHSLSWGRTYDGGDKNIRTSKQRDMVYVRNVVYVLIVWKCEIYFTQ